MCENAGGILLAILPSTGTPVGYACVLSQDTYIDCGIKWISGLTTRWCLKASIVWSIPRATS
jgi:hypothetical protein